MDTSNNEYKFTTDWFKWAPDIWNQLIPHMTDNKKILEVGSYEGRSSVWIMEHMMSEHSELFCIDTWEGGEEHQAMGIDMESVEDRFHHNISVARTKFQNRKVYSFKDKSSVALGGLNASSEHLESFDWIYIDGSHIARDVMADACAAWPLLKSGGFMVFDDYLWGVNLPATHKPKIAIDFFVNLFEEELTIAHIGYQFIVRKK